MIGVVVVFVFRFLFLHRAPGHTACYRVVRDIVDIDVVVYGIVDLYTLSVDFVILGVVIVELVHTRFIVCVDVLQDLVNTLTTVAIYRIDDCTNVLVVQDKVGDVPSVLFLDSEHELVVVIIVVVFEHRFAFQRIPEETVIILSWLFP